MRHRNTWRIMVSVASALSAVLVLHILAQLQSSVAQTRLLTTTHSFPSCGVTLQTCIDSANDGDTVIVGAPTQASGLVIDKPLNLDGQNSLGVLGASAALTITADNVTVSNAIFTGTAGSPVILIQGASTTTLRAISVTRGGTAGVLITGTANSGHLITGTSIYSNSGPGIHLAVTTTLRLVDGSILSNVVADGRGGGLCSDQMGTLLTIEGGLFQSNSVSGTISLEHTGFGGGLYVAGSATLSGTHLISNTSSVAGGGMAVVEYASLSGTRFVGNTSRWGGGLYQDAYRQGGVDVIDSRFEHNASSFIGGGLNIWGSTRLTETWLICNTAVKSGGGIYGTDPMVVIGGRVERNVAEQENGGGLRNWFDVTLTGTQVLSNTAGQRGGGLYQADNSSPVEITGGRFEANSATEFDGGGMYINGNAVLAEAQVISNVAGQRGGGLFVGRGADLVNDVLAENAAPQGAGLYIEGASGEQKLRHLAIVRSTPDSGSAVFVAGGTVGITNTIIASHTIGISHTGGTVSEDYNLFFGNAVSYTSSGGTFIAGGHSLYNLDPRFVEPVAGDYHIRSDSPARDAGANEGVFWDIDGDPRPTGSGCDIGADELPGASLHLQKTAQPLALNPGQTVSYTVMIANPGVENTTNVILTDTLPTHHRPITVTSSQGMCSPGSGWGAVITCTLGDLMAGGSVHITLTAEVTTTFSGLLYPVRNTVQARGDNAASEAFADTYIHDCHVRVNGNLPEYTEVQAAVDAATEGDTVMVAGTCSGVNERGGLAQVVHIDKAITLRGGYTITNWMTPFPITQATMLDAAGQGRVLYITGDISPSIEGFRITGGSAHGLGGYPVAENDAGGGIYIGSTEAAVVDSQVFSNTAHYGGGLYSNSGAVIVSGSLFEHNVATSDGGGLYITDNAVLIETQVISNTGRAGAGLYQYDYYEQVDVAGGLFEHNVANGASVLDGGGGLYVAGSANLSGTQLVENTSKWAGGGLYARRSARLTGVQVIRNTSDSAGGGLHVSGNAVLTTTTVVSNTAAHSGGGLRVGGALTVTGGRFEGNDGGGLTVYGSAVLVGAQVTGNTTAHDGGGLYVGETAVLSGTWVVSNAAGNRGGGLYVGDSAILTGTRVVSNTAQEYGGGVYQADDSKQVSVISGCFEHNVAMQRHGGGLYSAGSATLADVQVVGNKAGWSGGGMYTSGSTNLSAGFFRGNDALDYGGGLCVEDSMTMTGTQVVSNTAETGGGLYVVNSVTMTGTQVVSNTAERGGGLCQHDESRQVSISGARFERNRASGTGAGLYVSGDTILNEIQVVSNTAGWSGGGMYAAGHLSVDGAQIVGNSSQFLGGGLLVDSGATLSDIQVLSNTAVQGGGLFQGTVTGRVDVIGGRFERNVAVGAYGGGVFIWDTLALTQTQILSNSSRDMGGGVYVGKFAYLVDTELIGNSSGQGGGLLQWDADGWVEAVGGHLASNVAEVNGGALYVGGSATLREIQVLSNVAGQFGGGLYQSSSEGAVNITGSRFEGNAAEWSGGGLSLAGSTVLSGTEVVSNTAGYNGGGLSGGEVDVIGGSLARNTATDDGGGLYASGALSLAGAQVVSNTAGRDGGGLYAKGAMEATNSLFVANGATVSGDALYLAGRSGAQTIVNLTIAHPTLRASEAIRVTSGTVAITNTIVASHTCGIAQLDGTLIEDHNLYFGHVKAIQSTGGTLITGDHSLYDLDPRFLNPFCGDYHLTVGSPAIDTGASSGAPGFDIDGDPRPQHAGYDIGADEYSGGYLVYLPAILSNY